MQSLKAYIFLCQSEPKINRLISITYLSGHKTPISQMTLAVVHDMVTVPILWADMKQTRLDSAV